MGCVPVCQIARLPEYVCLCVCVRVCVCVFVCLKHISTTPKEMLTQENFSVILDDILLSFMNKLPKRLVHLLIIILSLKKGGLLSYSGLYHFHCYTQKYKF